MSASSNFVKFAISVMVVAVISQLAVNYQLLKMGGAVSMTIKGFLTFFAGALLYFPISLMLGGMEKRNEFFQRSH